MRGQVCELCGDIDESTKETCTADGYEADQMYHWKKCQKCTRIMFNQMHDYANSKCTICDHQCEHLFHFSSYVPEYHVKNALLANFPLTNRIHWRDYSVNADMNHLNSLYYP